MMVVKCSSKRKAGKPPEDQIVDKTRKPEKQKEVKETADMRDSEKESPELHLQETREEIPYAAVEPLPVVTQKREKNGEPTKVVEERGFKNVAPLQSDDKAKELIKEALRNPIGITTEDLLNISEPARQELRRLLTKKRLEKKSVTFVSEEEAYSLDNKEEEAVIYVEKLPEASYEIQTEGTKDILKGGLVIRDPVVQYLSTLPPGEKPKKIVVAKESHGLRAIYPLINGVGEVESLLDGSSQIVSMDKEIAIDLDVTWDPDIIVHMQSANQALC